MFIRKRDFFHFQIYASNLYVCGNNQHITDEFLSLYKQPARHETIKLSCVICVTRYKRNDDDGAIKEWHRLFNYTSVMMMGNA